MSRARAAAFARSAWPGLTATLHRHWLFALLLVAGIALRIVTVFAYRPAIFGITDSYWYLRQAEALGPTELRPIGYSAFLRLLPLGWGLEVVTVAQHALGLLVGTLLYAVLVRLGVRGWLAALGAVPALLDAYVLNIEHHVLAETFFHLLVVGACALLLWRRPLTIPFAALAGVLLAVAALTRPVGLLLVAPAALAALWLGPPRRRTLCALVLMGALAVPVVGYGLWFQSVNGEFGLTSESGRYLYGRVAPIAECSQFDVPARERVLCPTAPVGERRSDYDFMWGPRSPVVRLEPPPGLTAEDLASSFARRVIRNQPVDYLQLVLGDVLRGFALTKENGERGYRVDPWQFQEGYPYFFQGRLCPPGPGASETVVSGCERRTAITNRVLGEYGESGGESVEGLTSALRAYQRFGYAPGPFLLACLVAALVAAAGIGCRGSRFSAPAFVFAGFALTIALGSAAVSSFSWRYQLPELFLLPPAAALAVAAFAERRRASSETVVLPGPEGRS
jgi:hypothetical protein